MGSPGLGDCIMAFSVLRLLSNTFTVHWIAKLEMKVTHTWWWALEESSQLRFCNWRVCFSRCLLSKPNSDANTWWLSRHQRQVHLVVKFRFTVSQVCTSSAAHVAETSTPQDLKQDVLQTVVPAMCCPSSLVFLGKIARLTLLAVIVSMARSAARQLLTGGATLLGRHGCAWSSICCPFCRAWLPLIPHLPGEGL